MSRKVMDACLRSQNWPISPTSRMAMTDLPPLTPDNADDELMALDEDMCNLGPRVADRAAPAARTGGAGGRPVIAEVARGGDS
jgi:hypothetical protein